MGGGVLFKFHRHQSRLIHHKAKAGIDRRLINATRDRIIESIDQSEVYCEQNANNSGNLVFGTTEWKQEHFPMENH